MQQAEFFQPDAHRDRRNHELLGERASKILQNEVICARTDQISELIRHPLNFNIWVPYRHLRS